jgi:chemotaxis-related protein WspB
MLGLAFSIGPDRFALRCADLVEVIPRVVLRDLPHAPAYLTGMFTYRGAVAPVIDLCQLVAGVPCPDRLSSRIAMVHHPLSGGAAGVLGLLAERMTETLELDPRTAVPTVELTAARYLGDVYFDRGTMIQLVRLDRLLDGPLREVLAAAEPG